MTSSDASTQSEPRVPPPVVGRTTTVVRTESGMAIAGEIAEQAGGWLRVRGVVGGSSNSRDWWLPIATIISIEVAGDA